MISLKARLLDVDHWLLSPAPAARLATLRVITGGFVLVYLLVTVGEFARLADRPADQFEPVGVVGLLDQPFSAVGVWTLYAALLIAGSCFLAGFKFRISGPTFALLTLWWASYHSSWGQMLHFEHLFTLHLLVLGLSPAADAWSLDAHVASPARSVRYGWPIRLMAITTTLTYSIAAIAKLRMSGLTWIDGSTLGNHVAYSATRIERLGGIEPPLAAVIVGRPWLIAPAATAALLVELVAPIALLGGAWRRWWVLSAILLHLGTALSMFVWFPYHGLGFALAPLFAVERLPGFRRGQRPSVLV